MGSFSVWHWLIVLLVVVITHPCPSIQAALSRTPAQTVRVSQAGELNDPSARTMQEQRPMSETDRNEGCDDVPLHRPYCHPTDPERSAWYR